MLDLQEQVKGALIARMARGVRHGPDRASIREPVATLAHDVHHAIDPDQHFIVRCRQLAAAALGYRVEGPPRFGLVPPPPPAGTVPDRPFVVFIHGTSRADKLWPDAHWRRLIEAFATAGFAVVLPWGSDAERARSERYAAGVADAHVPPPPRLTLPALASLLARAELAVGVDTGLVHLAAALGTPTVSLFVATDPHALRRRAARRRTRATWAASARSRRPRTVAGRAAGALHAPRAALLTAPMRALYTLLWYLALPLLPLRLLWRGRREPGYREHVGERYGRYRGRGAAQPVLWVHAVSLGETRAAAPLVDRLRRAHPGGDRAADAHDGDRPRRRPRALRRPRRCRRGCPTTRRSPCARSSRISGRARDSSWKPSCGRISSRSRARPACRSISSTRGCRHAPRARYARVPSLARPMLAALSGVAAQTEADAQRLAGARRAGRRSSPATSNSTPHARTHGEALGREFRARFGAARPVWVAASTRDGEEALILDALAAHAAAARHADRHRAAPSAALRRGGRAPAPARRSRSCAAAATRPCPRTSTSCSATRWARCPATTRPRTSRSSAAACCRSAART